MKAIGITLFSMLILFTSCNSIREEVARQSEIKQIHVEVTKRVQSSQQSLNKSESFEVFAALDPRSTNGYVYIVNMARNEGRSHIQYYMSATEYSYAFRAAGRQDSITSGFKQVRDSPEMRENSVAIFEKAGIEFMAHGLDSMSTYVYRDSFNKAKKSAAFYKRFKYSHEVVYINEESKLPTRKVLTQYVNGDTTTTTWEYTFLDEFNVAEVFDRSYIDDPNVEEKVSYFPSHKGHSNFKSGDGFPNMPIQTQSEKRIYLESIIKKPTLVFIYFNDCVPCLEAIPEINTLSKKYAERFDVVGINWVDGPNATKTQLNPKPVFPLFGSVDDTGALDNFLIENFPTVVVLSVDRQILYNGSFISSKFNRNLEEYLTKE